MKKKKKKKSKSFLFSGGYILLSPDPITAIVLPFDFNAAEWATESIPRAKPLIIVMFCDTNSEVSFCV